MIAYEIHVIREKIQFEKKSEKNFVYAVYTYHNHLSGIIIADGFNDYSNNYLKFGSIS